MAGRPKNRAFTSRLMLLVALCAGCAVSFPSAIASAATKTTKTTKATKATKATARSTGKVTKTTSAPKTSVKTGGSTVAPTTPTTAVTATTTATTLTATTTLTAATTPVSQPAPGSGRIVVYSGRAERLVKPVLDQFTFLTGIEVSARYGDSAELAATLLEEGDRTRADVFFSQDAGALGALTKAGRFAKLPSATLSRVDARYRADDGTWVGVSGRARVFVYDPRQVSTPPQSIFDLTAPAWRGKIGYVPTNASFQSFVTALRVTIGESAARKWLTDFRANNPVAYPSNGAVVVDVNKGEIALGLVNHYYLYERIAADGRSAVVARNEYPQLGDPGALVNVAGVGVLKRSGTDASALALVDFLLGRDAQTYFADKTFEYPMVPSLASAVASLPPIQTVQGTKIDLSQLDSLAETLKMLREVRML